MLKSEAKAEELEKKAKDEMRKKNYPNALKFFIEAKEIYEQLNFKGKTNFIEKQLVQLKRVIEFEKQKGIKRIDPSKEIKNISAIKEKLTPANQTKVKLFYDDLQRQNYLQEAEKRRIMIKNRTLNAEKNLQFRNESIAKISEREEKIKREEKEREEKLKKINDKRKQQEKLRMNADWALEQAKLAVDQANFDEAKIKYKEAIDLFKELGWFDQVGILYNEIKNIEKYKLEHIKNIEEKSKKEKKSEEDFQKRINNILTQKRNKEEQRLKQLQDLTPEIKHMMEKSIMLKEKAEKEENMNINRAIDRYILIINIYKKIPKNKLDLTDDISELEKKIEDLQSKT